MNPHSPRSIPTLKIPSLKGRVKGGASGALLVASAVLIPVLAATTGGGFRAALDFTTGVMSLVCLTSSVVWGLLATDRLLMTTRHRLVAQAVHRATAVSSIGFLLVHVTVKIAVGHVGLLGALVPFGLGVTGSDGLIGLGSLAAVLMVVTAATGALRSAFANPDRVAGHWRSVHMLAYPAWCFALVHGLYAGRQAAGWVVTLYSLSLAGVAGALVVRSLPRPVRRRITRRLAPLLARVETAQAIAPDASTPQAHPADPASPATRRPRRIRTRRTRSRPTASPPSARRPTRSRPTRTRPRRSTGPSRRVPCPGRPPPPASRPPTARSPWPPPRRSTPRAGRRPPRVRRRTCRSRRTASRTSAPTTSAARPTAARTTAARTTAAPTTAVPASEGRTSTGRTSAARPTAASTRPHRCPPSPTGTTAPPSRPPAHRSPNPPPAQPVPPARRR